MSKPADATPPGSPMASTSPSTPKSKQHKKPVHTKVAVKPSWATPDEEAEEGPSSKKSSKEATPENEYSEKDSFIPKSPKQSKRNQKETRYWVPSSTRHVIISPDMLNNQTDLDTPYNPNPFGKLDLEARHSKDSPLRKEIHDANGLTRIIQKRKTRLTKMEATVLNRGYVPLVLRLISYIFSVVAIILAGLITRFSVRGGVETRPSTVMAFIVNAVALFYIPWVAKDEYFGRAVGIRSPKHKLKIILLDLLFIVLNSADLALAFNVLYDSEAGCLTDANTNDTKDTSTVCKLQQGMASVLFITLMGFVINFTVSLYRLVERIVTSEH